MSAATLVAVAHGAVLQAGGAVSEAVHAVLPVPGALLVPGAAEPSPSPSTVEIPPEDQTSPGLLGFLVTFAVAAAVIALAFSLVRHLRVVERNARRLEEEEAAAGTGTSTPGGAPTGAGSTDGAGAARGAAGPGVGDAPDDLPPGAPADDTAPEDRDRP